MTISWKSETRPYFCSWLCRRSSYAKLRRPLCGRWPLGDWQGQPVLECHATPWHAKRHTYTQIHTQTHRWTDRQKKVRAGQVLHGQVISELRGVTEVRCHTVLLAARHKRAHPASTPTGEGRYSIYLPWRDGRLSWPIHTDRHTQMDRQLQTQADWQWQSTNACCAGL